MKNKLSGLSDFKITGASLLKSSKEVLVEVSFRHIDYKRVLNYTPEERVRLREADKMAKIDNFIKKHVKRGYTKIKSGRKVYRIKTSYKGRELTEILKLRDVWYVSIQEIKGVPRKPEPKVKTKSIYGVKCILKTQVEGLKSGRQSMEECIYLVKARSHEEAMNAIEKKLKKEEKKVYYNADMRLVKYSLHEIVESFETFLDDFKSMDNIGEAFSTFKYRKLKPGDVWEPLKNKEKIIFS